MIRLGVFGGTFDPPHLGHVEVARDVADALGLTRLLWIPAAVSPFKVGVDATDAGVRLRMVEEAVAADPRFVADPRELGRPGPSFTVDTLEALREDHPTAILYLVVGADQFRGFPRWKDPGRILALARLAVMDRAGVVAPDLLDEVADALPEVRARVEFVPVRRMDVSSTAVREAVARGDDPGRWVPAGVARIIREEGLYGR